MLNTKFLLISAEELKVATVGLKPGKAPGPDGIPPKVMGKIANLRPEILLRMYKSCLREYIFPEIWKKQPLALISKGRATRRTHLRTGNMLERHLKPWLTATVENSICLSANTVFDPVGLQLAP